MKKWMAGVVLGACALFGWGAFSLAGDARPAPLELARTASQALGADLLAEVKAAIEAGGPVNAVEVCKIRAPAIAAELSGAQALTVGRTSLKPRNPANAPDAWEQRVLAGFARRQAAGEQLGGMEYFEVTGAADAREFRYMKAIGIPPGAPCLACHGKVLAPEVAARIQALYPEDQATGYDKGDLRGAFTVRVPL